jgi:flagellar basal body-associated protein FliL
MKREIDVPGNKLLVLYRIIVVMMLLLVVLLIAGSLYAFIRSRDSGPLFRIGGRVFRDGGTSRGGQADSIRDGGAVRDGDNSYNIFSGIGTMRIQNAGDQAGRQAAAPSETAVIIVSISFPYKADDRPFTEELASHIGEFRSIAKNYFANLPHDKLVKLDEEQAKTDILKQYNALLRLGKIETLYFSDLMIVD